MSIFKTTIRTSPFSVIHQEECEREGYSDAITKSIKACGNIKHKGLYVTCFKIS